MSMQPQPEWLKPLTILLLVMLAAILMAAVVLFILMSTALPLEPSLAWAGVEHSQREVLALVRLG